MRYWPEIWTKRFHWSTRSLASQIPYVAAVAPTLLDTARRYSLSLRPLCLERQCHGIAAARVCLVGRCQAKSLLPVSALNAWVAVFWGMNAIPCCIHRARTMLTRGEGFRLASLEVNHSDSQCSVNSASFIIGVVQR